jgi:hypothetical protein
MFFSLFKLASFGSRDGVSCSADGAFIGSVALLKRANANGGETWAPRDTNAISRDLSRSFGLLIDLSAKAPALKAIAVALNAGDIARAQMLALFLRFPDPAPIAKTKPSISEITKFVGRLIEGGFIKGDRASDKFGKFNPNHWPAGAPEGPGRFAPKKSGVNASEVTKPSIDGDTSGRKPTSAPAKKPKLKSWEEIVAEETRAGHVQTVEGPPLWMLPIFGEADGAEFIEEIASTLKPGPFAEESIPASGPKITPKEQAQIDKIGNASGCHTCGAKSPGTKNGKWIGDHQLPTRFSPPGKSQRLYPHCEGCSLRQGGEVTTLLRRAGRELKEWYDAYARKDRVAAASGRIYHRSDPAM